MEMPELSRRVFLRRSVQAAGALALLPGLAIGCAGEDAAGRSPPGLVVLDASQWVVLDAVADAFVPAGGAFEAGARSVDLATRIDAFLAGERPDVLRGVGAALVVLEWLAPLAAGRAARFSTLDLAGRSAAVDALRTSRIGLLREVYAGMKQLCLFTFYACDAAWPAIGYDGPLVGRAEARG